MVTPHSHSMVAKRCWCAKIRTSLKRMSSNQHLLSDVQDVGGSGDNHPPTPRGCLYVVYIERSVFSIKMALVSVVVSR